MELGTWYSHLWKAEVEVFIWVLSISYSTVVVVAVVASSSISVRPVFVFLLEKVCKVSLAALVSVGSVGSQR